MLDIDQEPPWLPRNMTFLIDLTPIFARSWPQLSSARLRWEGKGKATVIPAILAVMFPTDKLGNVISHSDSHNVPSIESDIAGRKCGYGKNSTQIKGVTVEDSSQKRSSQCDILS